MVWFFAAKSLIRLCLRCKAVFRLPHRGALQRIKRPSMNHIRFIGLKNFPDRLLDLAAYALAG